jgi:hypothetical protein
LSVDTSATRDENRNQSSGLDMHLLLLIVAGYAGLRSLEIALRPQEAFRTRVAQAVMTISAGGLFVTAVVFVVGEILQSVIALPWRRE